MPTLSLKTPSRNYGSLYCGPSIEKLIYECSNGLNAVESYIMANGKMAKKGRSAWFNTTVGEFVEAVYEAAMEEYMDEIIARRIAMQMLVRKLRMQHRLTDQLKQKGPKAEQKKAILRSELNKRRQKRK